LYKLTHYAYIHAIESENGIGDGLLYPGNLSWERLQGVEDGFEGRNGKNRRHLVGDKSFFRLAKQIKSLHHVCASNWGFQVDAGASSCQFRIEKEFRLMDKTPLILIVDDEEIIRNILTKLIHAMGYNCLQASNGDEALDLMGNQQPDCVLLDIVMPGMPSVEVIRAIRQNKELGRTVVIVISGADRQGEIAKHIQAGADDFLLKPFNATLFQARLKNCLSQSSHQQEKRLLQSELAECQLKLQQAEKLQEDFCSLLAHDLNNAVTGIMMTAELLLMEDLSDKTSRAIEDIMDSAEQLPVIIKQRRQALKSD
jgi:DNA-binding response OmpR family regulator